jgi:hypothetical protein
MGHRRMAIVAAALVTFVCLITFINGLNPGTALESSPPGSVGAARAAGAVRTTPPQISTGGGAGEAGSLRTVLDERFVDNGRGWPSAPQSTAWLTPGGYRLFAREPGHFVGLPAPGGERLRDVIVTARFQKVGGPPGGGYGLIVRDQPTEPRDGLQQAGRFYVLEAGDRGEVGIWRRDGDRWIDLVPWTVSAAVRPGGAANVLTVRALGPELTFEVNGAQVARVMDSTLSEGRVGLFVGGDLNEVLVEQFLLQVPR